MNMTLASPSIDKIIEGNALYGAWRRYYSFYGNTPTSASGTSGGITARKCARILVPSVAAPVTGFTLQGDQMFNHFGFVGLEYLLGTLTVSGNSFAAGVTMPIKTVRGEAVQTNADTVLANVRTTLVGATTRDLTLTYTNGNGVGSRTATLTLPTNPLASSCFFIPRHFQTNDLSLYALTGASINGGTGGVIDFYGLLLCSRSVYSAANGFCTNYLNAPEVPYKAEPGEFLGVYQMVGASAQNGVNIVGIPEL